VTWKSLHHPNVLQLIGVTMTGGKFVMVSKWMGNGNIVEFVGRYPDVNRLDLVCSPFVFPICGTDEVYDLSLAERGNGRVNLHAPPEGDPRES
jgi:hypothetical protein